MHAHIATEAVVAASTGNVHDKHTYRPGYLPGGDWKQWASTYGNVRDKHTYRPGYLPGGDWKQWASTYGKRQTHLPPRIPSTQARRLWKQWASTYGK